MLSLSAFSLPTPVVKTTDVRVEQPVVGYSSGGHSFGSGAHLGQRFSNGLGAQGEVWELERACTAAAASMAAGRW